MSQITAEVERTQRIIVTVDVEAFCEHYKKERADFDGDDEAYVRDFLDSEGGYLLDEFPAPDENDGVTVEGDYDDRNLSPRRGRMRPVANPPEWEEPPVDDCPCAACQDVRTAATVDLAEADRRATFDAICRVWDQAVANVYPNQQALRRELANLQAYLDLEKRP